MDNCGDLVLPGDVIHHSCQGCQPWTVRMWWMALMYIRAPERPYGIIVFNLSCTKIATRYSTGYSFLWLWHAPRTHASSSLHVDIRKNQPGDPRSQHNSCMAPLCRISPSLYPAFSLALHCLVMRQNFMDWLATGFFKLYIHRSQFLIISAPKLPFLDLPLELLWSMYTYPVQKYAHVTVATKSCPSVDASQLSI